MAQNPKEKQKRVPSGFVLARNSGKTLGRQASPAELIFSARCLAEASVRSLDSRVLKKNNLPMVTRIEERKVTCTFLSHVS